ncbi:MAG: adenosylhomocysteinase, partial [Nitrososphaerota archaeon]|nr:adenosylhomocysteinase [Nitrososphaerota archaeon]
MKVTDQKLSSEGERNFLWAKAHMGALTSLEEKYAKSKPLEGVRIGVCLHITKEPPVLIDALLSAGAEV